MELEDVVINLNQTVIARHEAILMHLAIVARLLRTSQ